MAWLLVVVLCFVVIAVVSFVICFGGLNEQIQIRTNPISFMLPGNSGEPVCKERLDQYFPEFQTALASTCVICLGSIDDGQLCRQLQCNHVYHSECICSWWLHKKRVALSCPLCKQEQSLEVVQSISVAFDDDACVVPAPDTNTEMCV